VGDLVAVIQYAIAPPGSSEGIKGRAHGSIANRVFSSVTGARGEAGARQSQSPEKNLLIFFPHPANFGRPVLVTAPIVEIIGDGGVAAADLVRILRHGRCRFDSDEYVVAPVYIQAQVSWNVQAAR